MSEKNLYYKYSDNKKRSERETIYTAIRELKSRKSIEYFISDYFLATKKHAQIMNSDIRRAEETIYKVLSNYIIDHSSSPAVADKIAKWCDGLEAILYSKK